MHVVKLEGFSLLCFHFWTVIVMFKQGNKFISCLLPIREQLIRILKQKCLY